MKTKQTFSVLAVVRKNKTNKSGEAPIYIRITVNGEQVEFSTKLYINLNHWDVSTGRVKEKTAKGQSVNDMLEAFSFKTKSIYNQMLIQDKAINAGSIKDLILGIESNNHTILVQFDKMVENVKALIGKDYRESTFKNYLAS